MIYLGLFSIALVILFFLTDKNQSFFILLFLFFSFLSITFPSGGDWIGYFNNYDCLVNNYCVSSSIFFEIGYEFLVKTFGFLGFQSVIIIIALINTVLLGKFAYNFDKPVFVIFFFMCIFLWALYVEAIRQALAISIFIYSLSFLYKQRLKKFILLIFLASLFHMTALVCLIFILPYLSKKLSLIVGVVVIIFSILFVIIPTQVLSFIIELLPSNSMASMKLNFYLISDAYAPKISIGVGTFLDILLIFMVFISIYKVRKKRLYNDIKFQYSLLVGVVFYFAFAVFAGKMMPVLTRIGWYGFPFIIILLYVNLGKSIFYNTSFSGKQDLMKYLVLIYFILQIFRPLTYDYNSYGIINQKTIFQKADRLDDLSLRLEAREKCQELNRIGYGYLCDN